LKLLLDEMLSPAIARGLRVRGHDVIAVKERPEWVALSDRDLLSVAREEQRAIVTNNLRDFRPLHAELVLAGGSGHAGLVLTPTSYRLTKAWTGRLVEALEASLAAFPGKDDLANGETWL
jgi:hypothetical protein